MNTNEQKKIEDALCRSMCSNVVVHERPDGLFAVETPLTFDDGDIYSVFIKVEPSGGLRISDMGHTLMHLSYSMDVDSLNAGTRGRLFEEVIRESGAEYVEGELFYRSKLETVGSDIIQFGKLVTQFHDMRFLNRARVESTFFEDLEKSLREILPSDVRVHKEYIQPDVPSGELYPIDFFIEAKSRPLYCFGVANAAEAKLTTIKLQHFQKNLVDFESIVVFRNQEEIPRRDLARLTNIGGEMVSSLDAKDELRHKVMKRLN